MARFLLAVLVTASALGVVRGFAADATPKCSNRVLTVEYDGDCMRWGSCSSSTMGYDCKGGAKYHDSEIGRDECAKRCGALDGCEAFLYGTSGCAYPFPKDAKPNGCDESNFCRQPGIRSGYTHTPGCESPDAQWYYSNYKYVITEYSDDGPCSEGVCDACCSPYMTNDHETCGRCMREQCGDPCRDMDCGGHGNCKEFVGTCKCSGGYTGALCETPPVVYKCQTKPDVSSSYTSFCDQQQDQPACDAVQMTCFWGIKGP